MQRLDDHIGSPCSTWEAAGSLSNRMQLEASAQRDLKSSRAGKKIRNGVLCLTGWPINL